MKSPISMTCLMPLSSEAVVLVPGLWLPGAAMGVLGARLTSAGFPARPFGYASVRVGATDNASRLASFALSFADRGTDPAVGPASQSPAAARRLHLVGHSTGGVLLLRALADHPLLAQRVSRVVLLGSPYVGCQAAGAFTRLPGGRTLLGRTLGQWLAEPRPVPQARHEIGVIAGSQVLGLASLIVDLPGVNDGVVTLEEARVPGARDLIVLPVAHSTMLLSKEVASEVAAFLSSGRFSATAPRP